MSVEGTVELKGEIDIFFDCLEKAYKDGKHITCVIINPKYATAMFNEGIKIHNLVVVPVHLVWQIFRNTPVIFSHFVKNFYVLDDKNWYERDILDTKENEQSDV